MFTQLSTFTSGADAVLSVTLTATAQSFPYRQQWRLCRVTTCLAINQSPDQPLYLGRIKNSATKESDFLIRGVKWRRRGGKLPAARSLTKEGSSGVPDEDLIRQNSSLKSTCSTNDMETASLYSEESSGFRQGSESDTVILCSNGNSHSSSVATQMPYPSEFILPSREEAASRIHIVDVYIQGSSPSGGNQDRCLLRSRLLSLATSIACRDFSEDEDIMQGQNMYCRHAERLGGYWHGPKALHPAEVVLYFHFAVLPLDRANGIPPLPYAVQVSPEGDIKINHLACLAHIQKVIGETIQGARILVFNCQDPDPNVTEMFDQTVDCCFDLNSIPDLQSFIRFCEMCYDWLASSNSNTVLFHAESPTATKRLLLLLFAYACFCDSVERQNIRTSKRLKAYLSAYPNGRTSVPVVYLRYSTYMKIFTPFRRQSISRATMSVYSVVVHNCPLFTDHSASIFFKFYSYSPLRHVYTTDVHKLTGRISERAVLLFTEEPISLRGNVIVLCYRLKPEKLERRRVFKLTFHSCEGHKQMLTFKYDAFDEISEAVPATFKMELHLTPVMDDKSVPPESTIGNNFFLENTKKIRHRNSQHLPLGDSIDPLNIIESRDIPLEAVRLSDSLEDIDHVPNRSSLLANTQVLEEVSRELVRNRNQTFNDFFMNACGRQDDKQWGFPVHFKRYASKQPPSPDLRGLKVSKTSVEDWPSNYEMSDRGSIDSGAGLHSDASGGVIDLKKHKSPKHNKSSNDEQLMPPPVSSVVPHARTEKTTPKSVAFLNSTPKRVPPPRPPPLKVAEKMDTNEVEKERQGKTPAGVRSVPTRYFGPLEKYQRVAEKDFAGGE
ncbi:Tensin-1 [Echinococcus granulosus]|uniref:Tensin-1 n=1 Tax=Echinococcus granulosus TaxID=6210 RepID=W6UP65_ECHGR|nr:Tensin-1 [Echinococcus granulosus]EUB62551.1 Tensin-1 [Echinococcus granulosus]